MQPSTTQQEVSLASCADSSNIEENENKGSFVFKDSGCLESEMGTDKGLYPSSEFNDPPTEDILGKDNVTNTDSIKHIPDDVDAANGASIQDDLPNISDSNDIPVDPDATRSSPELPESGIGDDSVVAF